MASSNPLANKSPRKATTSKNVVLPLALGPIKTWKSFNGWRVYRRHLKLRASISRIIGCAPIGLSKKSSKYFHTRYGDAYQHFHLGGSAFKSGKGVMISGKNVLLEFIVVIKKYTDFVVPADKMGVMTVRQFNWQS
jgi:hypothetical protein